VELKEKNPNNTKSLGRWEVEDTTSSGYHYDVFFDVT
jgi:hypothetical protein